MTTEAETPKTPNRKGKVLVFVCVPAALLLCLIALFFSSSPATDEERYNDMLSCWRLGKFALSAENGSLSPVFKPLGLSNYFNRRAGRSDMKLRASGYYTDIYTADTTTHTNVSARVDTVAKTFPLYCSPIGTKDEWCLIYCRTQDVSRVRVALMEHGLSVTKRSYMTKPRSSP